MEKQSFELINGMKSFAKVYSIVYDGTGSRLHFFRSLNRRILEMIEANPDISVIHYNDGLLAAFSLLHRGYQQIKRTATFHGLDVVFPSTLYQKLILPKFNRFDRIITVSHATADACIERGIDPAKVVVVSNGVDESPPSDLSRGELDTLLFDRYGIDTTDRKILVTMGRAVKRKGFSWFIKQIMPSLPDDTLLLMIGPVSNQDKDPWFIHYAPGFIRRKIELFLGYPSDESHIRSLMKDSVYHNRVKRLGKLPEAEVRAILTHADVFIMPNIEVKGDMEGFGLVCLEAAICGSLVMASASGGITDAIIPHKNGFLVDPGNVEAWKRELTLMLSQEKEHRLDPSEIRNFTLSNYSWSKMCKGYAEQFERLSKNT